MDIQGTLFGFFGGLALFLFGMKLMSEGLKKMGSAALKKVLEMLTKNRFAAIVVGLVMTSLIQSSSATSVMVVGLVNAGLMAFGNAVAVVLGADIGTTITAWLVSVMGLGKFSLSHYALLAIFIGFLINFLAKLRKRKMLGQAILGFGLLFLGLGTMSEGLRSLKESPMIVDFLATSVANPFLGLIIGILVTLLIQSSSVTIAIIQLMAFQGIFGLETALPLMFGADIGTTITAQLAAIGGTKGARGVAMANSFFKLIGALLFFPLVLTGVLQHSVEAILPGQIDPETGTNSIIMAQIAATHTVYIAINVLIFSTVLWPLLNRVARWMSGMKGEIAESRDRRYLDPLLLDTPPIAIQQCVVQLAYMTRLCHKNITVSFEAFMNHDLRKARKIQEREERIDALQKDITDYLVKLFRQELDSPESSAIPRLIHCINDAERIGDHAENIIELTEAVINDRQSLSPDAQIELQDYFALIDRQFVCVQQAMQQHDVHAVTETLMLEERINEQQEEISRNHIRRLEDGTCAVQAGFLFLDMISNLEKIGDRLTNIAERLDAYDLDSEVVPPSSLPPEPGTIEG